MFNLDPGKLLVIAVIAIILLGPDRLPQVARQVGGAWRSFNEFRHRMETEVRSSMPDLPPTSEIARLARSPSALLNHLSTMSPDKDEAEEAADGTFQPPTLPDTTVNGPVAPDPPSEPRAPRPRSGRIAGRPRRVGDRGHRARRPDAQLNRPPVVTLPFTAKRKNRPSPDNMTLGEHLGELRRRVIICVIAFAAAAMVAVVRLRADPALPPPPAVQRRRLRPCTTRATRHGSLIIASNGTCNLFVTSPLDGLSLRIKIALFGGLVLASPVILFQIWRFVTPGLKASERRYAIPFVLSAFVLFLLGAATAYLTLPHALGWLKSVGGPNLQAIYDPIPYLGLILLMMTIFGLTFEFPVVLVSLELAHVVTPARLLHSWRWAVIIIVVIAAVFTPSSDPFSMFALAIPLVAFYFISIGIGKLLGR